LPHQTSLMSNDIFGNHHPWLIEFLIVLENEAREKFQEVDDVKHENLEPPRCTDV